MKELLVFFIAGSGLLVLLLQLRPSLSKGPGGKILAFLGLFLLPGLALGFGSWTHLETSKTTDFCLSCHEMGPYGDSLWLEESEYLPAVHFQNRLVPRDLACYSCHTDYTMYGDLAAKTRGVRHLAVHYFGTIPEVIELYVPYKNRECLGCHSGSRSFEESEFHLEMRGELVAEETACLDCHDQVHAAADVSGLDRWQLEGGTP